MDDRFQLRRATSIYEPEVERRAEVAVRTPNLPDGVEASLRAILVEPRRAGELTSDCYRRKEHAIGAIFADLSVVDALLLQRRLELVKPGDDIAERFARLANDRRGRLLAFLVEIRRRGQR